MKRWVKHGIVLFALIMLMQTGFLFFTLSDFLYQQLIVITMTSNLIALLYAVYIFKLYDDQQSRITNKLRPYGIETLEDFMLGLAIKFKIVPKKAFHRIKKEWVNVE
jgi:hypothetical protein